MGTLALGASVRIQTTSNDKSGRIAFRWDAPVSYKAVMSGKNLRLSFSSTIDGDIPLIARSLSKHVASVETGDGGRALNIVLSGEYSLTHYPTGTMVIVEFTGKLNKEVVADDQAATPTPTPTPAPEKAATSTTTPSSPTESVRKVPDNLPRVPVRSGRHPDKIRLVFDWPDKVAYKLDRQGDVVNLNFQRPVNMEVAPLSRLMPGLIGAARSEVSPSLTRVTLSVASGAKVEDFYAGSKVVVDVFFVSDGSRASKNLPNSQMAQAPTVNQPAAQAPAQAATQASAQAAIQASAQAATQAAQSSITSVAGTTGATPDTSVTPTSLSVETTSQTALAGAVETATPITNEPYTGESSSGADTLEDGFVFRFDWDEPTGVAVFRRGGALWMVFDNPGEVNIDGMRQVADTSIVDLVQLTHPEAVILRAITLPGVNPLLRKDGLSWILEFRKQNLTTQTAIDSLAQPDSPIGARVFMPVSEPRTAIAITDPEIGDNFIVVPVVPLGYGVNHFYKYPQFRIRPASQGIVVEPAIDTLQVRAQSDGVSIVSSQPLYISPVTESDIARARSDSSRPLSRIVDFTPVQGMIDKFYSVDRQDLEHAVILAESPQDRLAARLELARFLLAHGYASEALGVVKVASALNEAAFEEAAYFVYRGISNWMLGRYEEASQDFISELLDKNDEGEFWRAIAKFSVGNTEDDTIRTIRSTKNIPKEYPLDLQAALTLKTIEAALFVQDIEDSRNQLELMMAQPLGKKYQSQALLLSGRVNEIDGKVEAAITDWENAIALEYEPTTVHADLARIKLLVKLGRISSGEALVGLEALRYAWRGGDFEFDLLRELGMTYVAVGGYRKGLETLRQAASYFRNKEEAADVTQQMSDVFSELFLEGRADDMLPVSAIGLYEDFKLLTPAGSLGDEMIRKLADRLVGVDLMDEAAKLLEDQLEFRLEGVEKARVGAQLAVMRALSRDYVKTLEALQSSEQEGLPEPLMLQRRYLKARALAGIGEDVNALLLLEEDEALEAEQLRAEIYRSTENWPRASQSLGKIVSLLGVVPGQPLSEEDASYVLDYAIVLTLGNNDRALVRLNQDFSAAMRESSLSDAFNLISKPQQFGLINYSSIANKVKEAERFKSFMTQYRARLESGEPLSSIN